MRLMYCIRPDVHLEAKFGQSCTVKYSFGVNRIFLYHCYVHHEGILHSTIVLTGAYALDRFIV